MKPSPVPAPKPAAAAAPVAAAPPAAPSVTYLAPGSKKFTQDELKNLPEGVDPTKREEYLDDETFSKVFGMNKDAFRAMPKWKRDDAKKKNGLF